MCYITFIVFRINLVCDYDVLQTPVESQRPIRVTGSVRNGIGSARNWSNAAEKVKCYKHVMTSYLLLLLLSV